MPRRFQRWGLLTVLLLLGSSAVGLGVRSIVKPKSEYNNYNTFNTIRPVAPAVQYRTDLVPGLQPFNPPRKAQPQDQDEFGTKIEAFQNDHARGAQVQTHFDHERMAEEWVRFGASQFRNQTPTSATIQADVPTISTHITGGPSGPSLLHGIKPSKVEILSVAHSMTGMDCWVLAKHTASENGVKHSWQARWWFTQKKGWWHLFDFEPQPHRLRFNALLAGLETARYRGMESKRLTDEVRQRYVLDLCDEFARITSREWDRYESTPETADFQAEVEYLPMFEMARKYIAFQKTRKGKQLQPLVEMVQVWFDSPVAWFAGARTDKVNPYRQHPWSVVLEARTQYFAKKPEAGLQLLRSALDESPGQADLLVELSRHLPASERSELGERAAKSPDPAASLQAIFEMVDHDVGRIVIDAYRRLRPEEPTGLAIDAALATVDGKTGEATRLLQAALETVQTRDAIAAVYAMHVGKDSVSDALKVSAKLSPRVFQCLMSDIDARANGTQGITADQMLTLTAKDLDSDPWHQYHSARVLMTRGQHEDALKILTGLLSTKIKVGPVALEGHGKTHTRYEQFLQLPHVNGPAARDLFRASQSECLSTLGRLSEAPFPVAAELMLRDAKLQELRDLMANRSARGTAPADDYWRGRIAVAEQRDSDAIRHFSQYTTETLATNLTPKDARILVEELTRAYLRTNSLQQAKQTLDWYYDGSEPMLKLMMVMNLHRNSMPDAKKFLAIYLAKTGEKAGREALALDPDLGPLLTKPKFQTFLK